MPVPCATVVIPTLEAGALLVDCLRSLEKQTRRDFEIVVVDNSGKGAVRRDTNVPQEVEVIENTQNVGYGSAVNQAVSRSRAPYVAVLNDDARPHERWLEALVAAMESDPRVGMCASRVVLAGEGTLDSAGMLLCRDGSSKQRGHGRDPEEYSVSGAALLPSGSAALYRRRMLEETGGFDDGFFLYCEDTDLGLRGVWQGWQCVYAADAVVDHHYSQTAGRVSALKAYYVERNRLFVVVKNFPLRMLLKVPFGTLARYYWHALFLLGGSGAAARFHSEGNSFVHLVFLILRAHCALLKHGPRLLRERGRIMRGARISAAEFRGICGQHSISPKEVAAL
ncbi:MAG: glycosyltransferase family 2 protein [Bryobacterales bacterium]|nr:glycosyltransferase family 2 protein [Bryobacterales bacterium]